MLQALAIMDKQPDSGEPPDIDPHIQKKRILYLLENNPAFLWAVEQIMANRGYGDITIKLARFKLHRVRIEIERGNGN